MVQSVMTYGVIMIRDLITIMFSVKYRMRLLTLYYTLSSFPPKIELERCFSSASGSRSVPFIGKLYGSH
jgi:hypothetical protein